ncbi:MAG: hypothetical protein PHX08_25030 [Lachnospiraceae bacterium]|nr:hypothetical protein [Lachnospiraceae bacterium]
MIKIRLQGTKEDIKWFKDFLEKHKSVKVLQFSEIFANKGTNKYFRTYAEIEKNENHGGKTNE